MSSKRLFSDYHAWKINKRSGNESRTLVYCFTEAGYYTRTPHVVWGILSSCIFSAEFAFALVVNTNEKTTAATVLMSIFFKKNFRFFPNLCGQTPHLWTNRGNRPKSCPKNWKVLFFLLYLQRNFNRIQTLLE